MKKKTPAQIGEMVRAAREAKGLSQAALADMVGSAQQTIEKIELGKVKRTSYLLSISHILGLQDIFEDVQSEIKKLNPARVVDAPPEGPLDFDFCPLPVRRVSLPVYKMLPNKGLGLSHFEHHSASDGLIGIFGLQVSEGWARGWVKIGDRLLCRPIRAGFHLDKGEVAQVLVFPVGVFSEELSDLFFTYLAGFNNFDWTVIKDPTINNRLPAETIALSRAEYGVCAVIGFVRP